MLIRTFSPFWFDFASTEYPQRLMPHDSIRTLPSFSSVSHTPSGEFADWAAVVAGACWLGAGADDGAVATTGEGSGEGLAGAGACSVATGAAGVASGACGSVFASCGACLRGRSLS